MGWASGSELFSALIESVMKHVDSSEDRRAIYYDMIEAFERLDWDTQDECLGIDSVFDQTWKEWEELCGIKEGNEDE